MMERKFFINVKVRIVTLIKFHAINGYNNIAGASYMPCFVISIILSGFCNGVKPYCVYKECASSVANENRRNP